MRQAKYISILLSAVILLPSFILAKADSISSTGSADLRINALQSESIYSNYLTKNNGAIPENEITIEAESFAEFAEKPDASNIPEGYILSGEKSKIKWNFHSEESGLYKIVIRYQPYACNGGSIDRSIKLDGELPYPELSNIALSRIWIDKLNNGDFAVDKNGNQIRPEEIELPHPVDYTVYDATGMITDPLCLYIEKGSHELEMLSIKEACLIDYIKLVPYKPLETYKQKLAEYDKLGYKKISGNPILIEAEKPFEKSNKTISPLTDRVTYNVSPNSDTKILLNTIGGVRWQTAGQWVSWKANVPEAGLYKITLKYRQNLKEGCYVSRRLRINGEVPFEEANDIQFPFDTSWKMNTLQGSDGTPYLFYLKPGDIITLEASLGDLANYIQVTNGILQKLNEEYRNILMITGPAPDVYRDYDFKSVIPNTLKNLENCSKKLQTISADVDRKAGGKGSIGAMLDKICVTIDKMVSRPKDIAKLFTLYKSDLDELAVWTQSIRLQPLELDYIGVTPGNGDPPILHYNFFKSAWFGLSSFFKSFFADYNSIGDINFTDKSKGSITVWSATGRDQLQIIRQLINKSFTLKTGIVVNLQLTAPGTLLPATVSSIGPDVALANAQGDPINFAIRGAIQDLSSFNGFDQIVKRFYPSAMTPFQFDGKTFALPETQTNPMFFYRTDIFEKLNLNPPRTWDDFYAILPILQTNNFEMGFYNGKILGGSNVISTSIFMYQNGGNWYNSDFTRSDIDSDACLGAFKQFTNLYTKYRLPIQFDFANRFRSGQMPAAIVDFSNYNLLKVFAPEIEGLWNLTPIPGTVQADGSINNLAPCNVTGVMMLSSAKNKDLAWEFMDWWTSADVQSSFASEMESILGPSAKYPTANIEAIGKMAWTPYEHDTIVTQMKNTRGIPEVPGGYYIPRYVDFAFNHTVINGQKATDALADNVRTINAEIKRKRAQFGLK